MVYLVLIYVENSLSRATFFKVSRLCQFSPGVLLYGRVGRSPIKAFGPRQKASQLIWTSIEQHVLDVEKVSERGVPSVIGRCFATTRRVSRSLPSDVWPAEEVWCVSVGLSTRRPVACSRCSWRMSSYSEHLRIRRLSLASPPYPHRLQTALLRATNLTYFRIV